LVTGERDGEEVQDQVDGTIREILSKKIDLCAQKMAGMADKGVAWKLIRRLRAKELHIALTLKICCPINILLHDFGSKS
jgi:hypothetical protein